MRRPGPLRIVTVIAALGMAACGKSGTTPSDTLQLAGNWSGTLKDPTASNPIAVKWTSTSTSGGFSGPIVLPGVDGGKDVTGTLTAAVSGTAVTLTLTAAAGSFTTVPACSVNGTGPATATSSSITSTLTVTFAAACVGPIADRPITANILTLAK